MNYMNQENIEAKCKYYTIMRDEISDCVKNNYRVFKNERSGI